MTPEIKAAIIIIPLCAWITYEHWKTGGWRKVAVAWASYACVFAFAILVLQWIKF
jgi:hypothetical protein